MKQLLKDWIIPIVGIPAIAFVFLFSGDGLQLGADLWPTVPAAVTTIATLLGNLMWILGVLFLIGVIGLVAIIGGDRKEDFFADRKEALIKRANEKGDARDMTKIKHPILLTINTINMLLGIGSGFWFTATAGLLVIILSVVGVQVMKKAFKELVEEGRMTFDGEVKENPVDVATKALHDVINDGLVR